MARYKNKRLAHNRAWRRAYKYWRTRQAINHDAYLIEFKGVLGVSRLVVLGRVYVQNRKFYASYNLRKWRLCRPLVEIARNQRLFYIT